MSVCCFSRCILGNAGRTGMQWIQDQDKHNKYEKAHSVWLTPEPKVHFLFPPPAEPGQLMFLFSYRSSAVSFLLRPCRAYLCGFCSYQHNQHKQSRVIKVSCSINKAWEPCSPPSSFQFLMMKSCRVFLCLENELFESITVIYLVRLKGKMWVLHLLKLYAHENFGRHARLYSVLSFRY